jgi:predicted Zn-dependent protease
MLSTSWSAVAGDPSVAIPAAAPSPASFTTRSPSYLGYDLPDLGGPANALISKADEFEIGRMELREIRDRGLVLEDPEVADYIQQLGMRLASQARAEGQSFTYNVMREPIVNAFATFGGVVFINSGLVLMTDNESELASVIAHETGHVIQRHPARTIEALSHMSLANMAAMLAAIAIGAMAGGGQGAEGAIALTQAASYQQQVNLIRGQEIEADAVGIELLAGAGFDPNAMASEFEQFSRMEGLALANIPPLLIDHPVTTERVAAARNRAANFPPAKPLPESLSYELFKERVRVLALPPEEHVDQYYSRIRDRRALSSAERYGEAMVQMQNHNAAAAVATLRDLVARYPQVTMLYATLGQALAANNQLPEALDLFRQSIILFPRNVPLTVRYGEALMQANRAEEAHVLLLDLFNNVDPTPAQIRLTALAASAAGDSGDAYEYMAEYDLVGGQLALANQQLELALATPGITNQQKAKFRARLDQVRGWLREQQAARHSG